MYEATNSGRVDVEDKTGEKERGCGTTCAELFGDAVWTRWSTSSGRGRGRGVDRR